MNMGNSLIKLKQEYTLMRSESLEAQSVIMELSCLLNCEDKSSCYRFPDMKLFERYGRGIVLILAIHINCFCKNLLLNLKV